MATSSSPRGAFLLAFTNIVAIQFASSLVLWTSGCRRPGAEVRSLRQFVKRDLVTLVSVVGLGVLLGNGLRTTIARKIFETSTTSRLEREAESIPGAYVPDVRFDRADDVTIVRAVVRGSRAPTPAEVGPFEDRLPPPPDGTRLELRVRFVPTITLRRSGEVLIDHDDIARP